MEGEIFSEESEIKSEIGMMSPLADPIVMMIYKDEKVAGLAAGSFINAVLSEYGEKFGKIVKLTPQAGRKQLGKGVSSK